MYCGTADPYGRRRLIPPAGLGAGGAWQLRQTSRAETP